MSVYFSDNAVLQMRRETMDTGKVIGSRASRGSHVITQSTKPLVRNPKDNKITIGITDALGGKRLLGQSASSSHSFIRKDGANVTSVLNAGVAGLTSPTLEWKDVYRQAESLFFRGEYEQALVWYHRGRRLRPKAREFQSGIAKCERAIENRCAMPASINFTSLTSTPVHSGIESLVSDSSGDSPTNPISSRTSTRMTSLSGNSSNVHTMRSLPTPQNIKIDGSPVSMRRERSFESEDVSGDTEVKHLRKLKRDKMYLRDLLREMDKNINNTEVQNIVEDSLRYLDTRSKFWKQQIPLHAIRALQNRQYPFPVNTTSVRDESSLPSVNPPGSRDGKRETASSNINHYILREVFKVHQDFLDGRYSECISRADRCLQTIQIHKSSEINKKYEILASLYGVKGNAYFQQESYKEALRCYYKDLEISKDRDLRDAKSRALENIGRVYARVGEFDKAVQVWKEKSALCKSDIERTWLYHEIGYCYLSKRDFSKAKQFGEMSYASAEHIGDLMWQLNSTTLIAQAEARLDDLQNAHDTFRYAMDLARLLGDKEEQQNIHEAVLGLKKAIAEEKEEKRRKAIEQNKAKKRSPTKMNIVLTDEDLWFDDWDDCESADIDEPRSNPVHVKGIGPRRRSRIPHRMRGRKASGDSPEGAGSRSESRQQDVSGLSLHGGGVVLRDRHNIGPYGPKDGRQQSTEEVAAKVENTGNESGDEALFKRPVKGILKNSNIQEMYSDLENDYTHANMHLLPAIARSNLQIGNVKPELGMTVVNIPVAEYDMDEEYLNKVQSKQVRFKDENETFKLPEIPPHSETTTVSEVDEELKPRRPMLEIDGFFIGKYA